MPSVNSTDVDSNFRLAFFKSCNQCGKVMPLARIQRHIKHTHDNTPVTFARIHENSVNAKSKAPRPRRKKTVNGPPEMNQMVQKFRLGNKGKGYALLGEPYRHPQTPSAVDLEVNNESLGEVGSCTTGPNDVQQTVLAPESYVSTNGGKVSSMIHAPSKSYPLHAQPDMTEDSTQSLSVGMSDSKSPQEVAEEVAPRFLVFRAPKGPEFWYGGKVQDFSQWYAPEKTLTEGSTLSLDVGVSNNEFKGQLNLNASYDFQHTTRLAESNASTISPVLSNRFQPRQVDFSTHCNDVQDTPLTEDSSVSSGSAYTPQDGSPIEEQDCNNIFQSEPQFYSPVRWIHTTTGLPRRLEGPWNFDGFHFNKEGLGIPLTWERGNNIALLVTKPNVKLSLFDYEMLRSSLLSSSDVSTQSFTLLVINSVIAYLLA
ncbi:hypothetical protein BDQ17DRAFT_1332615 [Cyathus striatus]|nr:hypothetical protein BDQ17DRAFT_1332615 [Cyathus striatus]